MKKVIFISCFFLLAFISPQKTGNTGLQFDGIYQQDPPIIDNSDNEHRWYLRFYKDGKVISKESIVNPEVLIKNFVVGNANVLEGSYTLKDNAIELTVFGGPDPFDKSKMISYVFSGTIQPNGQLKVKAKNNSTLGAGLNFLDSEMRFLKM